MTGTWLRRQTPADVSCVSAVHQNDVDGPRIRLDLRHRDDVVTTVVDQQPDLVIHAAFAKTEADIVAATRHVALACAAAGASLLHLSSDAVFAGDGVMRDEASATCPIDDYGRWKAAAESEATSLGRGCAIVRLPLMCSLDPPCRDLVSMQEGAEAALPSHWFIDEWRQPAWAEDVAAAIWSIALLGDAMDGVWHLPGRERLSRAELAARLGAHAGIPDDAWTTGPVPADLARPRDQSWSGKRAEAEIAWAPRAI